MKIITANRLSDGAVIYVAANGRFVGALDLAERFDDAAAGEALADVQKRTGEIAAAYLVDADESGIAPRERMRETIRSRGPSVRADLGKQAEAANDRL